MNPVIDLFSIIGYEDIFDINDEDNEAEIDRKIDEHFHYLLDNMNNAINLFKHGDEMLTQADLDYELVAFSDNGEFSTENSELGDKINSDYVNCPLSGNLKLKYRFESIVDIPISNQKFVITAYKEDSDWWSWSSDYEKQDGQIEGYFDDNGEATVDVKGIINDNNLSQYRLKIKINPKTADELKSELDKLYASYEDLITSLSQWLASKLEIQKTEIKIFIQQNGMERFLALKMASASAFIDSFFGIFTSIWEGGKSILSGEFYNNLEKMVENHEELLEKLQNLKEKAAYFITDEIAMFLFYYAFKLYLSTMTPEQEKYLSSSIQAEIIMVIISGGLTKAVEKGLGALEMTTDIANTVAAATPDSP